ncbi:MAG: universal stress protein, partial [Caldimonas sp.]
EFIELSAAALQERAEAAVEAFERQVAHGGLVSTEARVVGAEPLDAVVQASRCCDLLIVGQTDRAGNVAGVAWDFPRHAVLQGGVPVLVVPFAGTFAHAAECVLVAWKDTREAARALHDALPLLEAANRVVLLAIDETPTLPDRSTQDDLHAWLHRHGIDADVHRDPVPADVGEALLSRASDIGADLIVMGAYGHSRLREWALGGATRHLLDHMTLPTLMSH